MKKLLIIFLASFILFGCTKETPDQILMDAMNSKIDFINEENKGVLFKEFPIYEDDLAVPDKYAYVDMDNDGTNELDPGVLSPVLIGSSLDDNTKSLSFIFSSFTYFLSILASGSFIVFLISVISNLDGSSLFPVPILEINLIFLLMHSLIIPF